MIFKLSLPSIKTITLFILLFTFYNIIIMFILTNIMHKDRLPSHALLNSERLDYITTHLREMYKMRAAVAKDPQLRQSSALTTLLENLRAMEEVVSPWDLADINHEKIKRDKRPDYAKNEIEICPEMYMGTAHGGPLYDQGFETAFCDGATPLRQILTILLNFHRHDEDFRTFGIKMIHSVSEIYPGLPMIIAVPPGTNVYDLKMESKPTVSFLQVVATRNHGDVWNDLVNNAKTKYVLVARDLKYFDSDVQLERLVREMTSLSVFYIGGATLSEQGHWSRSCRQIHLKNHQLRYKEGYNESNNGCMYCEDLEGPFIASARALRSRPFDRSLAGETAFADFFVRLKRSKFKAAVCPDSMFGVSNSNTSMSQKELWQPFAKKWGLNTLYPTRNEQIGYSCTELGILCGADKFFQGRTVPICCVKEFTRVLQLVMEKCEKVGIECEARESTVLGAVKLGSMLPWDRGLKVTFLSSNHSAMGQLGKELKGVGLELAIDKKPVCCTEGLADLGTYFVKSPKTRTALQMVGQYRLTSHSQHITGHLPTKVLFGDKWIRSPRNPGLYIRNRYGPEVLKHAEERTSHTSDQTMRTYNPESFKKCPVEGAYDCLDQYKADGSLQFGEC